MISEGKRTFCEKISQHIADRQKEDARLIVKIPR